MPFWSFFHYESQIMQVESFKVVKSEVLMLKKALKINYLRNSMTFKNTVFYRYYYLISFILALIY
jgi:hypothetical protein